MNEKNSNGYLSKKPCQRYVERFSNRLHASIFPSSTSFHMLANSTGPKVGINLRLDE